MLRATVIWSPNWISCKVVPGLWTLLVVFYSQHGLTYATLGYLHNNRSLLPDADVCDGCYQQISWKVGFHYIYLFLSGVFSLHLKLPLRTHYRLVSVIRIQGCLILCSESVWFKTYVLIFCSPVTLRHYQSMFSYSKTEDTNHVLLIKVYLQCDAFYQGLLVSQLSVVLLTCHSSLFPYSK